MEAMDPEKSPGVPVAPRPRRRAAKWVVGTVLLAIVALAVLFCLPEPASSGPDFAWLQPKPVYVWKPPNALTRLKFRVVQWLGPLAKHLTRRHAGVTIDAAVFSLDSRQIEPLLTGYSPLGTNSDGSRAWLLSTNEFAAYNKKRFGLKMTVLGAGSIRTADRYGAGMVSGHFAFDVVPRVAPYIVRLRFSATMTEATKGVPRTFRNPGGDVYVETNGPTVIRTNLSVSCEVAVPNRGAVLLQSGSAGAGSNLWLLISASADFGGKPLP